MLTNSNIRFNIPKYGVGLKPCPFRSGSLFMLYVYSLVLWLGSISVASTMIPISLVLSLTWSKTLSDRFVWYRNAVNLFSLSLGSSLPSSSGAHGVLKGTFCTWEWKLQLHLYDLIMENNFSTEIHVQIPLLSPQKQAHVPYVYSSAVLSWISSSGLRTHFHWVRYLTWTRLSN